MGEKGRDDRGRGDRGRDDMGKDDRGMGKVDNVIVFRVAIPNQKV